MTKISVIVPCYNVSKYLNGCVDSIIDALVDDMEIVLVNDGSTDNTLDIIKEYKKNYKDIITVVDKKNGGLSDARNKGVEVAKGEYIAFIDSDDSVEKGLFKDLVKKLNKSDYDVVVFGENRIFTDHTIQVKSGIDKDCSSKEDIKNIMPYIYPAACNKVYKKELLLKVPFKKGVWFEDVEFIYRLLPLLNSIGTIDGYYYNYYQREGSITYTYNSKLYDFIDNLDGLVKHYKDNNIYDEYYSEIEYTYVRYLYATFIKRLAKMKNYNEYKKGVNIVIDKVHSTFPKYKSNKYLVGKKGLYLKYFNKCISKIIYIYEKNRLN